MSALGALKKSLKKLKKVLDKPLPICYNEYVKRGRTLGRGLENVSPTVVIVLADEKNSQEPLDKPHKMWYN